MTENQKEEISSLSSRANVTSHQASFVYNYGDFRGNVEELMSEYFDIMLYISNWGSRRLMFRIPRALIDMNLVAPYCISEEIEHWQTQDKEYVILDINFYDEELSGWIEEEGWLDDLVNLREELIQGDFRILYLPWLKAAENALYRDNIDEDTLELVVPPGLKQLSPELTAFVKLFEIDEAMIAVAAQNSGELTKEKIDIERWIKELSETEKNNFLIRLGKGERNLSIQLNRRLHELAGGIHPQKEKVLGEKHTISALIESAEKWRQAKKEEARKKAEIEHRKKMELLVPRKDQVWEEIYSLIEEKKSNSYDKAVKLLKELHDLAQYKGELKVFEGHVKEIERTYSNRPALLKRIKTLD